MIRLKPLLQLFPQAIYDYKLMRSILFDVYPENRRDIRVLIYFIQCGIVNNLISNRNRVLDNLEINKYLQKIENEFAVPRNVSRPCLLIWLDSLDFTYPEKNDNIIGTNETNTSRKIISSKLIENNKQPIIEGQSEGNQIPIEQIEIQNFQRNNLSIHVGDVITFGNYSGPIKWQILTITRDRALIISKYALETMPYNKVGSDITWQKSTIRKWLNGEFFDVAFALDEKTKIAETNNINHATHNYISNNENNDTDHVFLLSISEAKKYFDNNEERKCVATQNAIDNGSYVSDVHKTVWWWLRSPGLDINHAAFVDTSGVISDYGYYVWTKDVAIRPALWIYLGQSHEFAQSTQCNAPIVVNSPHSNKKLTSNITRKNITSLNKKLSIGDKIFFGNYLQNNNTKEPIIWEMLAIENGKALVISQMGLDTKPFNETNTSSTNWCKCSLRNWLNAEFMKSAFTSDEKEMIIRTYLKNNDDPTYDWIFLLDIFEAKRFFKSDISRQCKPTLFAKQNGAYEYSSGNSVWWLRSEGNVYGRVISVYENGIINTKGTICESLNTVVRPSFWLDLDKAENKITLLSN